MTTFTYCLYKGCYLGSSLRVEMAEWKGNLTYAKYTSFQLGNENSKYELQIGKYSGTAGDKLLYHSKHPFSTYDKDFTKVCAKGYRGAWWFDNFVVKGNGCQASNLNGEYLLPEQQKRYHEVVWGELVLKHVEIKVRRNI